MELKDQWQVCSLELAKRLKELGVKQESIWYWDCLISPEICLAKDRASVINQDIEYQNSEYSAFTVSELGVELPLKNYFLRTEIKRNSLTDPYRWLLRMCGQDFVAGTEANARALMWIHLKENNLIGGEL